MAQDKVTQNKGVMALDVGTAIRHLANAITRKLGRRVAGKMVTLDIDSAGIKLLEVRGDTVRKWASVTLEPGAGEEGTAQAGMGAMVKQLINSSNTGSGKVTASLSGLYSVARILPMPAVPVGLTLQEYVLELARDEMPTPMDRLYVSWQTMDAVENDSEQRVLILGVPRDLLDNEVRGLRAAGISPRILELKAIALTRVVNRERAIVINVEPASFDIVIIVNGVPEIMRTLAWQPDELTVEDRAEHLAVATELTVDFHNSHHSDTPLDPATPLFVTGQMSADLTLADELRARLGYPNEPLEPPLKYPPDLPVSQYAVNIGLALRGIAQSQNREEGRGVSLDMNLLPSIYSPWRPSARQLYSSVVVVAAISLLFPLFQITSEAMGQTANLETKYNIINNELEGKKLEIKEREPIQKAVNEFNLILNQGGNFTGDIELITGAAEKLGVQVSSITHEGGKISIDCQAEDPVTFDRYLEALAESGRFASPIPPPEGYPYTTGGSIKLETKASE